MIGLDLLRARFPRIAAAVEARIVLLRKAISFGLIGVVNTLVDFGVFMFGVEVVGLPIIPANLLSWTVAVTGSYVMNSSITFAAETGRTLKLRAYLAFVVSGIAGWLANTATLLIAAQVFMLPVWAAKAFAILVSFVVSFSLSHFVVFRVRAQRVGDAGKDV